MNLTMAWRDDPERSFSVRMACATMSKNLGWAGLALGVLGAAAAFLALTALTGLAGAAVSGAGVATGVSADILVFEVRIAFYLMLLFA